jgi:hypothetical protein
VCWKSCSSCRSFHLPREEFLSAPIHSPPLSGSPYRSFTFVEYKTSEDFSKASARVKQSRAKKEHDHHLGRGGYAFVVPKWRKMEDLLAQGTIPWPERVENWRHN